MRLLEIEYADSNQEMTSDPKPSDHCQEFLHKGLLIFLVAQGERQFQNDSSEKTKLEEAEVY